MAVSIDALRSNAPDILLGNVLGSNTANVLLILGLCAAVRPLVVSRSALRRDAVAVVAATLAFVILALDGRIGQLDGALLLAGLMAYVSWTYLEERRNVSPSATLHAAEADAVQVTPNRLPRAAGLCVLGLGLLVIGAQLLVSGAVARASAMGVSAALIGTTIVAVGTSLPELTISLVAVIRRQLDVAVGNVLGSNLFKVLGILGASAVLQALQLEGRLAMFDQWVMLVVALLLIAVLWSGRRVARIEGFMLLTLYIVSVVFGLQYFE